MHTFVDGFYRRQQDGRTDDKRPFAPHGHLGFITRKNFTTNWSATYSGLTDATVSSYYLCWNKQNMTRLFTRKGT